MRSKAFECVRLFTNYSFLISLCLWNLCIFLTCFVLVLRCRRCNSGKGFLFPFVLALFHGLAAQCVLLQFKLLAIWLGFRFYELMPLRASSIFKMFQQFCVSKHAFVTLTRSVFSSTIQIGLPFSVQLKWKRKVWGKSHIVSFATFICFHSFCIPISELEHTTINMNSFICICIRRWFVVVFDSGIRQINEILAALSVATIKTPNDTYIKITERKFMSLFFIYSSGFSCAQALAHTRSIHISTLLRLRLGLFHFRVFLRGICRARNSDRANANASDQ